MRLAYKIWLDNNGKAFGEGPYELLTRVERTGSLNRAAAEMGMSYNKAWRLNARWKTGWAFRCWCVRLAGLPAGARR